MHSKKQIPLFPVIRELLDRPQEEETKGSASERLPRLDTHPEWRDRLLPLCRLREGEIWEDPIEGHRVGVLDATRLEDVLQIMGPKKRPW